MATRTCSQHPGQTALYGCKPCGMALCVDCVTSSARSDYHQCRGCNALVTELAESEQDLIPDEFLAKLPSIARFFSSSEIWLVLTGLALAVAILSFVGGTLLSILIAGIEASVFFNITLRTASGSKLSSDESFDFFDSIVQPFLLLVAAALPLLASLHWAGTSLWVSAGSAGMDWGIGTNPKIAIVLSLILFPLLLTIAAISRSILSVLNPILWVETLRAFGLNYLYGAIFFYFFLALEFFVFAPLAGEVLMAVSIPVLGPTLALVVLYLPRAARYRGLGALCEPFLAGPVAFTREVPDLAPARIVRDDSPPGASALTSPSRPRRSTFEGAGDRDILQQARKAAAAEDYPTVFRAVEALWKNHASSECVTPALWLAALAQEARGENQAMQKTLRTLVARDPEHPLATEAQRKITQAV